MHAKRTRNSVSHDPGSILLKSVLCRYSYAFPDKRMKAPDDSRRDQSCPNRRHEGGRQGTVGRSEERRVGKECVSRVDLGGRRIIKKKIDKEDYVTTYDNNICSTLTKNSKIDYSGSDASNHKR